MYNGQMYGQNQMMINQLLRQKDNIENMLNQYSQPQQAPVQNIINTGGNNLEFEARILKDGEDYSNIAVSRKTLFVDEKNNKVVVKEVDGSILQTYEIIVPLDEKDKKIMELEEKIKKLEVLVNVKSEELIRANEGGKQSDAVIEKYVEPQGKSSSKSISKTTK